MGDVVMHGVREYQDGAPVVLQELTGDKESSAFSTHGIGRLVIQAVVESGHVEVGIDLLDLIKWLKENRPDLLA